MGFSLVPENGTVLLILRLGRAAVNPPPRGNFRQCALKIRACAREDCTPSHCEELLRTTASAEARQAKAEAIQLFLLGFLDCFAPLAMTLRGWWKPRPVIARSACDEVIQLFLFGFLDASLRSQ
jgi:hypothetical protein